MANHKEDGFYGAGESIISETKRARTVRLDIDVNLQPVYGGARASGEGKTEGAAASEEVEQNGEPSQDQDREGEVIDTDTRPIWEKMQDKVEELADQVTRHFEDDNGRDGRKPPVIKAPLQPTREQFEQHQATHTPYAAWCKYCAAARAARRQHPKKGRGAMIVFDTDGNIDGPIKVSIAYMYLSERTGKNQESNHNPPYLVMIEHRHGRCWACQVPNRGVNDQANCLPRRMVQDLDNNGMRDAKIQLKRDQEPSIVNIQTAVQEIRPGMVVLTNSPVGESQCNGRVENAIKRIQERTRALRHQLENGIRRKIPDDVSIMSWLVKWAAEVLSKYAPGDDGRTPYERIRQETCVVPIAPFGEAVLYLPLTILKRSKGQPVRKMGI